jgi:hypothetical protein
MFDPHLPEAGTEIDAVQMRSQLNGLKDLIDAIQTITTAVVDGTSTLSPGSAATVTLSVSNGTLHFSFAIPQGFHGADGGQGEQGIQGIQGIQGERGSQGEPGVQGIQGYQGEPGEVTLSQLDNAIAGTSSNSNGVALLGMAVSDPPTQGEVQLIVNKLDELITALRR